MMETANLRSINGAQMIVTQDFPDAITGMIKQQIARLKQEYGHILNCKVAVAVPAFCQTGIYQVRIAITSPTLNLKVDRAPTPDYYQEDLYVAIWSAFDLARKQLKEHSVSADLDHTTPVPIPVPSIRATRRSQGYARG